MCCDDNVITRLGVGLGTAVLLGAQFFEENYGNLVRIFDLLQVGRLPGVVGTDESGTTAGVLAEET